MAEPVSLSPGSDNPPDQALTPLALAKLFHATYERLAPDFGYRTREESAKPWADVPAANRALMLATCYEIIGALAEAGRLLPAGTPEITEEWMVEATHPSTGSLPLNIGPNTGDRGWARRLLGNYDVVRWSQRTVRSWPDGSQWTGPWQVVDG